jgi:hypothetical protein
MQIPLRKNAILNKIINEVRFRFLIIISLVLLSALFSCTTYKPVASQTAAGLTTEGYIDKFKDLAVSEMRRTGIPASITLAQGIIESDIGRSRLATEANNHFGIKCHDDWNGPTIRHSDDRRNECFRKYRKPEESYADHSDFLKSESRYRSLYSLDITDYKGWARGLKRAGYATNPDYANMLIRKIEEFNLYNYDRVIPISEKGNDKKEAIEGKNDIGPGNTSERFIGNQTDNYSVTASKTRLMERNRIQYIIVKEGDTRESLEKEFDLLKWELARYNELQSDFTISPGQILYLQPKRAKADFGKDLHTVSEGETMHSISQMYGIKVYSLFLMNRMEEGQEPVVGQRIWLRSMKPVD